MSHYYLDTSALVKYYVSETGSGWVRALIRATPQPLLVVSHIVPVEVFSALTRRLREEALTAEDFSLASSAFWRDYLNQFQIVIATAPIINAACELLERRSLRAFDAIHLAVALEANRSLVSHGRAPLVFLSADDRLNHAVSAEGLAVDNPNLYP
jgi:hypothetical protein